MTQDVTTGPSLRNAYGEALVKFAPDYDFVCMDADVVGGVGLSQFRDQYPNRFIQCGIAEQAMVGAAAGFNLTTGRKVFCNTFGQFAKRAYEIFEYQVAYQYLDVVLAISHLGLDTGPDGASCQPLNHIPLWTSLSGVAVIQPADGREMEQVVEWLLRDYRGPVVLFTGRSPVEFELPEGVQFKFGVMKGVHYEGNPEITFIACGQAVGVAIKACDNLATQGIYTGVMNCSTLTPFDEITMLSVAKKSKMIVTIEDHGPNGLYSLVTQALGPYDHPSIRSIRVDGWGESGEAKDLYRKHGLTGEAVAEKVRGWLE